MRLNDSRTDVTWLFPRPGDITCNFLTNLYLVYLFSINLLYIDGDYSTQVYGGKKTILLLVVSSLYAVSATVLYCKEHKHFFRLSLLDIALITYAAVCTVSSCISIYFPKTLIGWHSWNGLLSIIVLCLVFICIEHCYTLSESLPLVVLCAVAVEDFIIILQLLGFDPFNLYGNSNYYGDYEFYYGARRQAGTFGNLDPTCCWLGIMLSVAIAYALYTKRYRKTTALLTALTFCIMTIVHMKLGIVGCVVAIICVLPLLMHFSGKAKWVYYLVLVGCVGVALVFIFIYGDRFALVADINRMLHGDIRVTDIHGRAKIWRDVILASRSSLVLGKGADTIGFQSLGRFVREYPELGATYVTYSWDSHNIFLNILHDFGILGLSIFMFILLYGGILCVRGYSRGTQGITYFTGALAWCIAELFCVSNVPVNAYFVTFAAIAFSYKEELYETF